MDILSADWDHLFILDGCRYDTFADTFVPYVAGDLEMRHSPGTGTPDFLQNTFTEPIEDVIYISANPFVSRRGSSLDEFRPDELFHEVYELWDTATHPDLGAVPPLAVSKKVTEVHKTYPDKRIIAHFIQPHIPFLSYGNINQPDGFVLRDVDGDGKITQLRNRLDNRLKARFGKGRIWWVKDKLRLPAATDMEIILRKEGTEALQTAYEHNLECALFCVRDVIATIDGDVIVTADHGELLGENDDYGHGLGRDHPVLRRVPWFNVDRDATLKLDPEPPQEQWVTTNENRTRERSLESRLQDLGYM